MQLNFFQINLTLPDYGWENDRVDTDLVIEHPGWELVEAKMKRSVEAYESYPPYIFIHISYTFKLKRNGQAYM